MKQYLVVIVVGIQFLMGHLLANSNFARTNRPGTLLTKVSGLKDVAYGTTTQADGKLLVVGSNFNGKDTDLLLMRYLPTGSLDASFADRGLALIDSKLGDDAGYAVAVTAQNKILVVGSVSNGRDTDFLVLQFSSEGALDTSFGRKGISKIDFGNGDDVAYAIAIQPDGKIVVGGNAFNGYDSDFALARLEPNGLLDRGFGRNGRTMTAFGDRAEKGTEERGYSVLVQKEGKILLSGYSSNKQNSVFVTLQYTSSGQIDRNFGVEGSVITTFSSGNSFDKAYASALQSDGRFVVAGTSGNGKNSSFAIARYLPSGMLDATFGKTGSVVVPAGARSMTDDAFYSVGLSSDGKVTASGSLSTGGSKELVVARFLPTGNLDLSFGNAGIATTERTWKYSTAYGMSLDTEGKVNVVGVASFAQGFQVALARFLSNGQLDAHFGKDTDGNLIAQERERTAITAEIRLPSILFR